jgi:predicted transcriptional regulator
MPSYETMMKFLSEVQSVIDKTPELFVRYYRNAFLVVAFEVVKPDSDPDKLVHTMFRSIDHSDFRNLYSRLKTLSRNDERLMEIERTLRAED